MVTPGSAASASSSSVSATIARLRLLRDLARGLALDHSASSARRQRARRRRRRAGRRRSDLRRRRARRSGRAPARSARGRRCGSGCARRRARRRRAGPAASPQVSQMPGVAGGLNVACQGCPFAQTRPARDARDELLLADVEHEQPSILRPCRRSSVSSASAWGTLRGKPSSRKPLRASGCEMRSISISITSASGTSSPASMYVLARAAELRAARAGARAACRRSRRAAARARSRGVGAWVPLPAPGGPKISRFLLTPNTLLQEALVVPHHHLRRPAAWCRARRRR